MADLEKILTVLVLIISLISAIYLALARYIMPDLTPTEYLAQAIKIAIINVAILGFGATLNEIIMKRIEISKELK